MNLIQHYIIDVHSVSNITSSCKYATEPMYEVDITVDCNGVAERKIEVFSESAWKGAEEKGWYLG